MINKQRLVDLFNELSAIDNATLKEAHMCGRLKEKLSALGIDCYEDDAGSKLGGSAGNLYAYIEGTLDLPPILLSAHMDSVGPANNKKAVFHPDGRITSDGTTVLGADDISGICAILEAVTAVIESGKEHRPIEVVFDVAEEIYCSGIKEFNFSRIRSREAYIFDLDGPVGAAAAQAPSIITFRGDFYGRTAHAGFSPESGIHAIKAAVDAASAIECGRIQDVTVNIGTIHGGSADNVVPDHCCVTGEVRSLVDESARVQLTYIEKIMRKASDRVGTELKYQTKTLCRAYEVKPTEPVIVRFKEACSILRLSGDIVTTFGGSDNNHFFHQGIQGIVVAPGMNNCHSCHEYTSVVELEKAARLAKAIILSGE